MKAGFLYNYVCYGWILMSDHHVMKFLMICIMDSFVSNNVAKFLPYSYPVNSDSLISIPHYIVFIRVYKYIEEFIRANDPLKLLHHCNYLVLVYALIRKSFCYRMNTSETLLLQENHLSTITPLPSTAEECIL